MNWYSLPIGKEKIINGPFGMELFVYNYKFAIHGTPERKTNFAFK